MRAQELAEGRRARRVQDGAEAEVEPCRLRLARDQKTMGLPRHTNFKHQHPVCRLVNFLNPSVRQYRSDLTKHMCDISCGKRHQRCLYASLKEKSFTAWTIDELF